MGKLLIDQINLKRFNDFLNSSNHSILISGSAGSGKRSFYIEQIRALTSRNNPDNLFIVELGSGSLISIDNIKLIGEFIKLKSENMRFILIDSIDKMSPEASGALLKTLEEPTPNVKFVLIAESKSKVLPTILSRTMSHEWVQPSKPALSNYFSGYASTQKDKAYAFSQGNFMLYNDFLSGTSSLVNQLADAKQFISGSAFERTKIIQKFAKDPSGAQEFLESLLRVQSALIKSSRRDSNLLSSTAITLEAYEAIKLNAKVNLQLDRLLF